MVTTWVGRAPAAIVVDAGEALSAKSDTTRTTVVVWFRLPLVPEIVSVYLPDGVVELIVTLSVEAVVAGLGLKLPVAPTGSPARPSVTGPLKPPVGLEGTL